MTDILDRAQKIEELEREQVLKSRFKAVMTASLTHCEDCGEEIPHRRREMIKGCTRCVDCQTLHERKTKEYRR